MAKMRIFKFWNEEGNEKEVEKMSLKKAVMSVQGDFKNEFIGVEFITKKGEKIETTVKIPMGRKVRQSIITEKTKSSRKSEITSK